MMWGVEEPRMMPNYVPKTGNSETSIALLMKTLGETMRSSVQDIF